MKWKNIAKELKGKISFNEQLKPYTSFKIGGEVPLFIREISSDSLLHDLIFLNSNGIPYKILGNATNLLINDTTLPYAVIKIETSEIYFKDNIAIIDAGIKGNLVIQKAKKVSLGGLEFIAGIPGTVGGMIKLNAGAYGGEIGDFVISVMLSDGKWHENPIFSYRNSNIEDIVIKAKLKLCSKEEFSIDREVNDFVNRRINRQPTLPSAGSIFKKPEPDFYVGKAIDDLGLKGYKIGGAMISKIHAGFIVNTGNATFSDVVKLIEFIKKEIYKVYKLELELEINIWR
jgi:UDP-N-acetylmuramate dehydrogenase